MGKMPMLHSQNLRNLRIGFPGGRNRRAGAMI
jgi:hypothetical protein